MKKLLLIAVAAFACTMAYAQPRAIGGRLGYFDGVSYEHSLGESNMIEVELGLAVDGFTDFWRSYSGSTAHSRVGGRTLQAAFTYDWIDPFNAKFPWEHKGEWHWYMGVGAAGGYGWNAYSWGTAGGVGVSYSTNLNWGFIGAAGRVGVEYDFWFPLQLSIDWRPTLGGGLFDNGNGGAQAGLYWEVTSIALGVRYRFHQND